LGGREDAFVNRDHLLDWGRLTSGDLTLRQFPGGHMFFQSHESEVIEALRNELSEVHTLESA
jgi:surfactin synthase thioesterase subunit